MAILLTKDYQEISRVNLDYAQLITYAKYSAQSRDNNTTTYQLKTTYYIPSQSTVSFGSANAYLDDAVKTYGYTTFYRGETTVQEITRTITHNDDGSSPTKSVYSAFYASFGGSGETRADIIFPAIQRYAIATSGTNFNDEENPTLTFTNIGLYGLRAKILVGNTEIYSEDLPDQTVTSYTYNLTTSQRNQLRQLCTGQSMSVSLAICSVDTNDTILYTSTASVVMSIVNAMPTFTYVIEEQNQKVIDLLGSSSANTVISNASHLLVTTTFSTYKYATASLYNIKEGIPGDIYQSYSMPNPISPASLGTYVTNKTNSGKFRIRIVDSRGFETVEVDTQRTLLLYREVKINSYSFKRQSPISSNVIFNGDFNYWGNVGNYTNTPVVKYKLDNGSWATIPSSNYSIDTTNHKLTISNYEITNILPYNQVGQFSISIEDALTSKEDTNENYGRVLQGVPTFEAGEHDLKVNGTLYVADTNGDNKVDILSTINALQSRIATASISSGEVNNLPNGKVSMDAINSNTTQLTLYNGGIKIGSNVSKVLVSGQLFFASSQNIGYVWTALKVNNNDISIAIDNPSSYFASTCHSPALVSVNENDVIALYGLEAKTGKIRGGANTYITVQVVE